MTDYSQDDADRDVGNAFMYGLAVGIVIGGALVLLLAWLL